MLWFEILENMAAAIGLSASAAARANVTLTFLMPAADAEVTAYAANQAMSLKTFSQIVITPRTTPPQ